MLTRLWEYTFDLACAGVPGAEHWSPKRIMAYAVLLQRRQHEQMLRDAAAARFAQADEKDWKKILKDAGIT